MLQFVQRAALVHSKEWIHSTRSAKSISLARNEREWKVPWHPCDLACMGGVSALLQCKSKAENKARLNKAMFSLFFLFFRTNSQHCLHAASLPSPGCPWAAAGSCSRPSLGTSGERDGLSLLSPFAARHRSGRGKVKSCMKWEDSLPSGADSPDNLAPYLQEHKAFNCMSFWCFWIASLWRWNSNHHQSYRLATDRKK